jgi:hypothetical protein
MSIDLQRRCAVEISGLIKVLRNVLEELIEQENREGVGHEREDSDMVCVQP